MTAADDRRTIVLVDEARRGEILDGLLRASITAEFAAGWAERRADTDMPHARVGSDTTVPLPDVRLPSLRDFLGLGS